jgi:hypothetical protein
MDKPKAPHDYGAMKELIAWANANPHEGRSAGTGLTTSWVLEDDDGCLSASGMSDSVWDAVH